MNYLREYILQTIIMVLGALIIIGGSLLTGMVMKSMGYPHSDLEWPWWNLFVVNWGFCLLLIPAIWVWITIRLERRPGAGFTKRWVSVTGLILLIVLAVMMLKALMVVTRIGGGVGEA